MLRVSLFPFRNIVSCSSLRSIAGKQNLGPSRSFHVTPIVKEEDVESGPNNDITSRLKRLSMQSSDQYVPSDGARRVRERMNQDRGKEYSRNLYDYDQKHDLPNFSDKTYRKMSHYEKNYGNWDSFKPDQNRKDHRHWEGRKSNQNFKEFRDNESEPRNYLRERNPKKIKKRYSYDGEERNLYQESELNPQQIIRQDRQHAFQSDRDAHVPAMDLENISVEDMASNKSMKGKDSYKESFKHRSNNLSQEMDFKPLKSQKLLNQARKALPGAKGRKKSVEIEDPSSDTFGAAHQDLINSNNFSDNTNAVKKVEEMSDAKIDLTKLAADPDTFGTLSIANSPIPSKDFVSIHLAKEIQDIESCQTFDDEEEDDFKFKPEDKWTMKQLQKRVKELLSEHQITDAVEVFIRALQEGGFNFDYKDLSFIYRMLINNCANVGNVDLAFRLYKDLKERDVPLKPAIFSSLINACANSPWQKEKNLKRIENVKRHMVNKGMPPNKVNYHVLIKAYGRLEEIESAFSVVDEMIEDGNEQPDTTTFNMLLQACISNQSNGFRHAMITWRKMLDCKIEPDIYTYNLLLRTIRECSITHPSELKANKLRKLLEKSEITYQDLLPPAFFAEENESIIDMVCEKNPENLPQHFQIDLPNNRSLAGYEAIFSALQYSENRLAIIGGLKGFMAQMASTKTAPNLKTVTELVQIIHPSEVGDLNQVMKSYAIPPDIDFFNVMMKKFIFWNMPRKAYEVLRVLSNYNLSPNIVTWGVLSCCCDDWKSAENFLKQMDQARFRPNIVIMGGLLYRAVEYCDPLYVVKLMDELMKREILPDERFVLKLDSFKQQVQKGIVSFEMGKDVESERLKERLNSSKESFDEKWKIFKVRYNSWSRSAEVDEIPEDPFLQEYKRLVSNIWSRKKNSDSEKGPETEEEKDFISSAKS